MDYVFSEEIYLKEHGLIPKEEGEWIFGDRNRVITVVVGEDSPLSYKKAKKEAVRLLHMKAFPIYRTVYLLPRLH